MSHLSYGRDLRKSKAEIEKPFGPATARFIANQNPNENKKLNEDENLMKFERKINIPGLIQSVIKNKQETNPSDGAKKANATNPRRPIKPIITKSVETKKKNYNNSINLDKLKKGASINNTVNSNKLKKEIMTKVANSYYKKTHESTNKNIFQSVYGRNKTVNNFANPYKMKNESKTSQSIPGKPFRAEANIKTNQAQNKTYPENQIKYQRQLKKVQLDNITKKSEKIRNQQSKMTDNMRTDKTYNGVQLTSSDLDDINKEDKMENKTKTDLKSKKSDTTNEIEKISNKLKIKTERTFMRDKNEDKIKKNRNRVTTKQSELENSVDKAKPIPLPLSIIGIRRKKSGCRCSSRSRMNFLLGKRGYHGCSACRTKKKEKAVKKYDSYDNLDKDLISAFNNYSNVYDIRKNRTNHIFRQSSQSQEPKNIKDIKYDVNEDNLSTSSSISSGDKEQEEERREKGDNIIELVKVKLANKGTDSSEIGEGE